ncbi:hypothetical protein FB556_1369 [Enteractinococcus coprophilus]|uniref:Uncharacterized protein n=1 Tax=Enteractinococcus coprophilus TaxID=1027633 RepID=A0A543AJF5_9MICC|nr:hypothetical protein FB556_1369 [Enteractinococcus coprophilus]
MPATLEGQSRISLIGTWIPCHGIVVPSRSAGSEFEKFNSLRWRRPWRFRSFRIFPELLPHVVNCGFCSLVADFWILPSKASRRECWSPAPASQVPWRFAVESERGDSQAHSSPRYIAGSKRRLDRSMSGVESPLAANTCNKVTVSSPLFLIVVAVSAWSSVSGGSTIGSSPTPVSLPLRGA